MDTIERVIYSENSMSKMMQAWLCMTHANQSNCCNFFCNPNSVTQIRILQDQRSKLSSQKGENFWGSSQHFWAHSWSWRLQAGLYNMYSISKWSSASALSIYVIGLLLFSYENEISSIEWNYCQNFLLWVAPLYSMYKCMYQVQCVCSIVLFF